MKKITTLICGVAMAAALSTPVHAGGKSTSGSATTMPPAAAAAALARPATRFTVKFVMDTRGITSSSVASIIAALKSDISKISGVSEDRLNVEVRPVQ